MTLTISPDLRSLIPPLTPEEFAQLEANLLAHGCLNPLIVWQETQTLLDGHNRHTICEQHGITYHLQEMSLPDLDAAKAWMITNQLGRRNLTPEQQSYLRGKQYEMQKQQGKRTDLTSHQSDGRLHSTAHVLAAQHHVGTATIERDGSYARAVDTLADAVGPDVRSALLSREMKLTQVDVKRLVTLLAHHPETVPALRDALAGPDPATTLRALITAARCTICHRPLSAPTSLSRGIGPICAGHGNGTSPPAQSLSAGASSSLPILAEMQDPAPPVQPPSAWQNVASGDCEWYTPDVVLDRVREVLGTIDVDPASCAEAQARVQATTFYTRAEDGLRQPWPGTVFLNPPYKLPDVARFVGKLCEELEAQQTTEAIVLVNAATETDWFQRAFARADAVCFPDGRLHFVHATKDNGHPCQGQALLYYGPHHDAFCAAFAALGVSTRVACLRDSAAQLALTTAPPAPAPVSAPADPPSPPLTSPKVCRSGHAPYDATKKECPRCVALRQRATRQRKAARQEHA